MSKSTLSYYSNASQCNLLKVNNVIFTPRITRLNTPTVDSDGVNKAYVDQGYNTRTEVNTQSYDILYSDQIIGVLSTIDGTVSLQLPEITQFKEFIIVDEGGNALNNPITINAFSGNTIIGQSNVIINGNYNSIRVYNNGTDGWFLI